MNCFVRSFYITVLKSHIKAKQVQSTCFALKGFYSSYHPGSAPRTSPSSISLTILTPSAFIFRVYP